jgi:hypothetical protein
MVRRSFRLGLRMGLLLGLVAAFAKLLQARRGPAEPQAPGWSSAPPPWTPPVPVPAAVAPTPPPTETAATPAPVAPPPAPVARVDAVPAPAKPIAVKKAPAVKKTTAAKAVAAATPRPKPAAHKKAVPKVEPWVLPSGDVCPTTHPVKAKLSSKLFHLPGMFAYDRTKPDRCYTGEAAATSDGFSKAKR